MKSEALRLLNPKGTGQERSSPAHRRIRPEDVAVALSQASSPAAVLARIMHADQRELAEVLEREMLVEVTADRRCWNWDLPRPGWIRDMVRLGVVEVLQGGPVSATKQAELMGMAERTWYRHWRGNYVSVIRRVVDRWEADYLQALDRY